MIEHIIYWLGLLVIWIFGFVIFCLILLFSCDLYETIKRKFKRWNNNTKNNMIFMQQCAVCGRAVIPSYMRYCDYCRHTKKEIEKINMEEMNHFCIDTGNEWRMNKWN